MNYTIIRDGEVLLNVSEDEVLTLRHCILEALEALSNEEFLIRTGGESSQAESLLEAFIELSTKLRHRRIETPPD